jgi:Fe-S cluster biogenesis protein NfuA/nitrite reductase/ring-hydroxylating ferredoxin subunit
MTTAAPRDLVADMERLLADLEALPDPFARQTATAAVQGLLELYGAGLERIVDAIAPRDVEGNIARALADDELVAHLLLIHGLHPMALEDRLLEALDSVRPYLESHGGSVELAGVDGTVVRLRLQGSCSGCPSSAVTLKLAIENAIRKSAPEIEEVIAQEPEPASSPLLQIELAPGARSTTPDLDGTWEMAGGLPELASRALLVKDIAGTPLMFLKLAGRVYAYRPSCPACERSLADAQLRGAELTCPGCGQRYDGMRAGRGLDRPQLHLEPVPLLEGQDGLVRVALPVAA